MSQTAANLSRIIDEDISVRVTQFDVIYEAITNAIIAEATEITCVLNTSEMALTDTESEIVRRKVDKITITDNGNGFTDKNFRSFCEYRTDLNKNFGCKGVGRLVFLKVYEDVNFRSELAKENEIREFKFIREFDTESLNKQPSNVLKNYTEITLSGLTKQYLNHERHLDRRIELDLEMIRERVLLHLIPTLFFFKKKGKLINIKFIDATTSETAIINSTHIPNFKEKSFKIKDKDNISHEFVLNYYLENVDGKLSAYYCGNNRTVCEFSEQDFKVSLPYGHSGFFLLGSVDITI